MLRVVTPGRETEFVHRRQVAPVTFGAIAARLPERKVELRELRDSPAARDADAVRARLQIPKLRQLDFSDIGSVRECEAGELIELAVAAVEDVLRERGIAGDQIGLIVDYSTLGRDQNGISLAYRLQARLKAAKALPVAIGNGSCASFQVALKTAAALMRSDDALRFAVLFAADQVTGPRYHPPLNVLGDGASAVLLERDGAGPELVDTVITADGTLHDVLGINHSDASNFDADAFENRVVPLHYYVTSRLVGELLARQRLSIDGVALFIYQNMHPSDAEGLAASLDVPVQRVFAAGLRGRGHVFGSDLVINLCLAREQGRLPDAGPVLLISSGAGYTWGATLLQGRKWSTPC